MKLHTARFLSNENIHPEVIEYLRRCGLDVVTAAEARLLGAEDTAVLRRALAETRVVVTHDADFGRLAVAAGEPLVGIIYLRPGHIRPEFTVESLAALFARELDAVPPFVAVARRTGQRVQIRLRHLPRKP